MYSLLTDKKVPFGFSMDDKKELLMNVHTKIMENYGNQIDAKVNGDNQEDKNKIQEEKDNGMEN